MTEQAKPGPDRERPRAPAPPPPPAWRNWLLVAGLLVSILILFLPSMGEPTSTELSYSNFLSRVRNGDVNTAVIDADGAVNGTLSGGGNYETQIPTAIQDQRLAEELEANDVEITAEATPGTTLLGVIFSFLPFLLLIGVYLYIGRRAQRQIAGGVGGILGSRAKVYDAEAPSTRFSDVAGYEGAKQEISEVVDFLKQPDRYAKAGAMGPRGVLMVGPPGTGKTLLARAVAGEAGVPFFAITGSGFVELFVGVGASRVRDLFADAKKRAPAIIFIDEIDAIGQRRGAGFATNDEREQTLNQLLAEMDGFDRSTGIVVLAATNRPEILDPALLRPGRFDRNVEIPLPNQKERAAILAVHSRGKPIGNDVDLDAVARATPGFSGADLANLVNEAAIFTVRGGRDRISENDFSEARDRILLGRREASNALLPEEKRSVAVHEAGHAVVAALSKNADPVAKVTILPAGRALGVTEQLPENERRIYPESYLHDSLAIRLGGRAAEQLALGEISSGAANDLAGATQLAIRMVREFGMSPRLGPIGYSDDGPQYLGPQQISSRGYAEETQRLIDAEVERLLKEADERATELLRSRRTALDEVVGLLLERETIDGEDIMAIVGGTASRPKTVVVPEEAPSRT
ncbi:MAG TPA: ATP-dependent zinc metalloprotease FtsH [Actinomycetota bacterium]|jgi:cell division protease FtsH|nr:ATP-dependent zinc metalloprotease FtsH [Actinomycetota bacterium]